MTHDLDRRDLPDRRIRLGIFVLTFVLCASFSGGGGWNQNSHFDLTRAIVEQRTLAIDRYASNTGDFLERGGRAYANKAPGLSLAAALVYLPVYAAERAASIDVSKPLVVTFNSWVCTAGVCATSAALIAALLFDLARRSGSSRRRAVVLSLSGVVATPLLPYSTMLYLHVFSGALMLVSFAALEWRSARGDVVAGAAAALATLSNYLCGAALVAFGLLALARRGWRSALLFTMGALPFVVLLAVYQHAIFGSVLQNPVELNEHFRHSGAALGVLSRPTLEALFGITISPYRGLFYSAPLLLFAFGGVRAMYRRDRAALAAIGSIILFFFAFNTSFKDWNGGFGVGPRYLVPVIALMMLLVIHAGLRWRWLFGFLVALSLMNSIATTAVDPQPHSAIKRPLEEYVYPLLLTGRYPAETLEFGPWTPRLFDGHTSVNRQSIDEILPFAKFRPGSRESEWASFNAGEFLFGAGSAASLLPIFLWLAGGTALLVRFARKSDAIEDGTTQT